MKGPTVHIKDGGVWLAFEASNGKSALVNAEAIAESHPPVTRQAILDWIEDRKKAWIKPGTV